MKYAGSNPPTASKSRRRTARAAPSTHGTAPGASRSKKGWVLAPSRVDRTAFHRPVSCNEQAAWCGEASTRGLDSTLSVDESGPHDPGVGMHVELFDERLHRAGVELRVGVEDECVLPGACGNATVRGTAVADVRRRSQQARSWMILQDAARHLRMIWSCRRRSLPGHLWANRPGIERETLVEQARAFRS